MSRLYVIAHGDVWRNRGENRLTGGPDLAHVCDGTGEMAIAYDGEVLMKVGEAKAVREWCDRARAKAPGLLDDLAMASFPVSEATVSLINDCVERSGLVAKLPKLLDEIGIADPSLAQRPRYPS
jgi:hypothetical protein